MVAVGAGPIPVASADNPPPVSTVTPYEAHVSIAPTPDGRGYWVIGLDGGVFTFGDAGYFGSIPSRGVNVNDITGVATTPDGGGYWLAGSDGRVFAFGDARWFGWAPGRGTQVGAVSGITSIASTPDGGGYWLLGADGGIFSFGDAGYFGSLPGIGVTPTPTVIATAPQFGADLTTSGASSLAPTPDGKGYWILGPDGGVFGFGDAAFYGSVPAVLGHSANAPCGDLVATPSGQGYWVLCNDGGVFSFGDAQFFGSVPGVGISVPPPVITGFTSPDTMSVSVPLTMVTSMARTPDGGGYWMTGLDGGIFAFGDAPFVGSVPGIPSTIESIAGVFGPLQF